jgi:AraC family transcriptional regulator
VADEQDRLRKLLIEAELQLPAAHVFIAHLHHEGPDTHQFRRERVYWLDLCLTPRRPKASARYVDHWSTSRSCPLGSLVAFPPRKQLELRSSGGDHVSVICQLKAETVEKWYPPDFTWTDRRLETALDIANDAIRALMMKLNAELKSSSPGRSELCQAIVAQLSIELARHMAQASEKDEKGGLASWRQRLIEQRLSDRTRAFPTVGELAQLSKLSARQLSRAFRASRGCSVGDYLTQYRIETAKRSLGTSESLRDIAFRLGFATQSSFTAAFRRSTGVTPKEYRNRLTRG